MTERTCHATKAYTNGSFVVFFSFFFCEVFFFSFLLLNFKELTESEECVSVVARLLYLMVKVKAMHVHVTATLHSICIWISFIMCTVSN